MAERNFVIRLAVDNTGKVIADLDNVGKRGQKSLNKILASAKPASAGLKLIDSAGGGAQRSLEKLRTSTALLEGPLGKVSGRFGTAAGAIGTFNLAGAAMIGAVAGISAGLVGIVRAGDEHNRLMARTEAVIRATGGAAGLSARDIDDLSKSQERLTGVSANMVTEASAVLLTFKSIREEQFAPTIKVAQDLAAVLGTNLNSTIVQIGKALEDPTIGLSALREVGVSFTEQQREQIIAMTEAGHTAEAQTEILALLQSQVGGAATAEGDSLTGAFGRASGSVRTFLENLDEITGASQIAQDALDGIAESLDGINQGFSPQGELENTRKRIAEIQSELLTAQNNADQQSTAIGRANAEGKLTTLEREMVLLLDKEEIQAREVEHLRLLRDLSDGVDEKIVRRRDAEAKMATEKKKGDALNEARLKVEAKALATAKQSATLAELDTKERQVQKALNTAMLKLRQELLKVDKDLNVEQIELTELTREQIRLEVERGAAAEARRQAEKDAARERERADKKAAKDAERAADKAAEEMQKPFDNMWKNFQREGGNALTEFFEDGKFKAGDFGDALGASVKRGLGEFASLNLTKFAKSVFTGSGGGLGSIFGGGSSASAGGGGGFGLGNLFSGGSMLASMFGGGSGTAAIAGSTQFMGPGGTMFGNAAAPSAMGTAFSALGGGMFGGGVASMFGLGNDNMLINSGASALGGLAGIGLMPFIGPLGPLVGGFLGSVLGGLFGGGSPTVRDGMQIFDFEDGRATFDQLVNNREGDVDKAQAGAQAAVDLINGILDNIGGTITTDARFGFLSKVGGSQGGGETLFAEFTPSGPSLSTIASASPTEEGFKQIVETLVFKAIKTAAEGSLTTTTTTSAASALTPKVYPNSMAGAVQRQRDSVAAANGTTTTTTTSGVSSLQGASDNVVAAIRNSVAEDLAGLASDIDFALFVDGFDEMPDAITAAQQAIEAINQTFDESAERAEALGISLDSLDAARERELAKLVTDFDLSIEQSILGFTNPLQLAMDQLIEAQEARLREAEFLNADLVDLERLGALERQKVMEQFGGSAMSVIQAMARDARQTADDLLIGNLSPLTVTQRFNEASALFARANATALETLDPDALRRAQGLASDVLQLNNAVNAGGTPEAVNVFNAVQETLRNLADSFGASALGENGALNSIDLGIETLRLDTLEELEKQTAAINALILELKRSRSMAA